MLTPADIAAEHRLLRNYARTMCRDADLAEDLAQETLIKAIQHRDQFTVGGNLRGWLVVIMRHTWYTQMRASNALIRKIHDYDDTYIVDFDGADATEYVGREVRAAIDDLHPTFAAAVRAVYLEELPYDVTADRLGVPLGTVKSRVNRAKQQLQHRLRQCHDNA